MVSYSDTHRLCIHVMHPTEARCLFHKHRWPAAFKILEGKYEMGLTYCEKEFSSDEGYDLPFAKLILNAGSYYEMAFSHLAHYVKPLGISTTLMITGSLYKEDRKEVLDRKLKSLSDERVFQILQNVKKLV